MTSPAGRVYESLQQRTVIVTGGGRGLGREMALALVEQGANVTITAAHSADELAAVTREAAPLPGRLHSSIADTTSYRDCSRVVQETLAQFDSLHCLINNAGRGMRLISETFNTQPAKFWQADPQAWKTIVDININGAFNMAHAVCAHLVGQGFGKIINISTSLQTMVRAGYSPYGPSKAALEAASRVWTQDLHGTGVTVNVLLPGGATDTALLPESVDKAGADGLLLSPALMREPALWLCSDGSNAHTGERYIARLWDTGMPPAQAARAAREDGAALPQLM